MKKEEEGDKLGRGGGDIKKEINNPEIKKKKNSVRVVFII